MSAETSHGSRFSRWRDWALPYLLIAPTVAVLLALSIYPLLYAIKVAFQNESSSWTFANFTRLASDSFFLSALWHTLIYATVALTFEFLLGLGLALLLDRPLRGRSVFRAILLIPMMLPPVVVGVVWRLMLNPDFGAVNGTLKSVGINTDALTWTASPMLAFVSVIAVDIWQWTPFMFLVLLAGTASHTAGALRSRDDRRRKLVANFSARDAADAAARYADCVVAQNDGLASRLRSDIHTDGRRAGIRHRNRQPVHLSLCVSLL